MRSTQNPFSFPATITRSKLPLLQALAPNPIATGVEGQNLEHAPATIHENKPVPARRVLSQMSPHTRRQPIERTAHIGRLRAKPDPNARGRVQHDRAFRTRRITPPPSSSSTSHDETALRSTCETSTNIESLCSTVRPRSLRLQRSNVLSDTPCDKQKSLRVWPVSSKREINSSHSLAVRRRYRLEPFVALVFTPDSSMTEDGK